MTDLEFNAIRTIVEAAAFAAEKHRFCRRKDVDATPYINHPLRVAQILIKSGVDDVNVLVAAILHDTVEDTGTSPEELERHFGAVVAGMVAEVTDDKTLEKQERKDLQVKNAPKKSDSAKLIKLADKASNLEDLIARPPAWPQERIERYRRWALMVAEGCQGVNGALDGRVAKLCGAVMTVESIEKTNLDHPNPLQTSDAQRPDASSASRGRPDA